MLMRWAEQTSESIMVREVPTLAAANKCRMLLRVSVKEATSSLSNRVCTCSGALMYYSQLLILLQILAVCCCACEQAVVLNSRQHPRNSKYSLVSTGRGGQCGTMQHHALNVRESLLLLGRGPGDKCPVHAGWVQDLLCRTGIAGNKHSGGRLLLLMH